MTPSAMSAQATEHSNRGVVASVRGSVVDVRFEANLPPIYSLLRAGKGAAFFISAVAMLIARPIPTHDATRGRDRHLLCGRGGDRCAGAPRSSTGRKTLSASNPRPISSCDYQGRQEDASWSRSRASTMSGRGVC
jgi:hypothetical protein